MQYSKKTALNGVAEPEELVDQAYVERFTSTETLRWFRELGGTETLRRGSDGTLRLVSVSPDGKEQRVTVFRIVPSS